MKSVIGAFLFCSVYSFSLCAFCLYENFAVVVIVFAYSPLQKIIHDLS